MSSSASIQNAQLLEIQQEEAQRQKASNDAVYKQLVDQQLNSLMQTSQQVGQNNPADQDKSVGATQGAPAPSPIDQHTKDMIDHGPIFLAIMMVLMTGPDSGYHVLAQDMGNINQILNDLKKFSDMTQQIQDDINNFMNGTGDPQQIAQDIANAQSQIQNLLKDPNIINELGGTSSELYKDLSSFSQPGGSLDQVISEATAGKITSWSALASNGAASDFATVKAYLTNESGGAAGAAATGVFKNLTDLLGGLSTQNSAQMEELNLTTKKVDADEQLVAAAISTFKSISSELTNYSGS